MFQPPGVYGAKPLRGYIDVGGETTVNVVAGHLLCAADIAQTTITEIALSAGYDCGDHHRLSHGYPRPFRGGHHVTADLVSQGQGQRLFGAYAVIQKSQVGVADAAASHLHGYLTRCR